MSKYIIFRWGGGWRIYVPDTNRDPVPLFSTFAEADAWLEVYLDGFGESNTKDQFKILAIPTPLFKPNGDNLDE